MKRKREEVIEEEVREEEVIEEEVIEEEGSDYIFKNLCVICGIDMGPNNPRQLCGKTMCMFEDFD
jgi:hypothetical protein